MTQEQFEAVKTIITTQLEIESVYQIASRIVATYGKDELDEQLVEDIKTVSNAMVERFSREQQEAMRTWDTSWQGEQIDL